MAKLRLKLFHLSWFSKFGFKSGIRMSSSHSHKASPPHIVYARKTGRIYASPFNHKGMDVCFRESPNRSTSPLVKADLQSGMKDIDHAVVADTIDVTGLSSTQRTCIDMSTISEKESSQAWIATSTSTWTDTTNILRSQPPSCSSFSQDMTDFGEQDHISCNPSAPERKSGCPNRGSLDMLELERRLKALQGSSEEKRKYYRSPVHSIERPSPIFDCAHSQVSLDLTDDNCIREFFGEETTKTGCEQLGKFFRSSNDYMQDQEAVFPITDEGLIDVVKTIEETDSSVNQKSSRHRKKSKETKRHNSSKSAAKVPHLAPNFLHASSDCGRTKQWMRISPSMCTIEINDSVVKTSSDSGKILEFDRNHSQIQEEQLIQKFPSNEGARSCVPHDQNEFSDDLHNIGKKSGDEFSYSDSKHRLLSGALSLQQNTSDSGLSNESDLERGSNNYTKFKLRKRSLSHGNLRSYEKSSYQSLKPEALGQVNNPPPSEDSDRSCSTDNLWFCQKKSSLEEAVLKTLESKSFRASSPKVDSKVFESLAMEKCSYDPHQDFKDSMIEMIVVKELYSSNDLLELLQCYLALNCEKYHATIVEVFREVWSDLFHPV